MSVAPTPKTKRVGEQMETFIAACLRPVSAFLCRMVIKRRIAPNVIVQRMSEIEDDTRAWYLRLTKPFDEFDTPYQEQRASELDIFCSQHHPQALSVWFANGTDFPSQIICGDPTLMVTSLMGEVKNSFDMGDFSKWIKFSLERSHKLSYFVESTYDGETWLALGAVVSDFDVSDVTIAYINQAVDDVANPLTSAYAYIFGGKKNAFGGDYPTEDVVRNMINYHIRLLNMKHHPHGNQIPSLGAGDAPTIGGHPVITINCRCQEALSKFYLDRQAEKDKEDKDKRAARHFLNKPPAKNTRHFQSSHGKRKFDM